MRLQQEEAARQESERQRLASFKSAMGMESEYQKLDNLLAGQKWQDGDKLTKEIMLKIANRTSQRYLDEASIKAFPSED